MTFYSHSKKDDKGNVSGSKELKTHILGVLEKALFHFQEDLDLGFDSKELKALLKWVVNLHDLGKYTSYFQNYLLKNEPIDQTLKAHAQIGGFTAFNLLKEDKKKALLTLYLIFLHHSQLIDPMDISLKLDDRKKWIIEKQIEKLNPVFSEIEKDISMNNIKNNTFYPEEKDIRNGFKRWVKKQATIQDYFLINYLFSLLIEGDKLDASNTIPYELKEIEENSVDKRFGTPEIRSKPLTSLNNNELRNYCRAVVMSQLKDHHILDHYIFTLTAPTGIGKTMTALDFSLKLKEKIKNKAGTRARIIYGLPFINIIEQALNEYHKTLENQDIKILGHYQFADIFGEDKTQETDEVQNYNQKIMALDTWQADIVITSFVQFFETLIGNRNKLLKKFNHFAHAIIILDEVQTLRLDQMPLLGAALFYLSKFLKSRIILMTATRPKIFELAQKEILSKQKEVVEPKELLTNFQDVFALFSRTAIHPLLDALKEEEDIPKRFVENIFSEKWEGDKSCIIVCNTVQLSIELYQKVSDYLEQNELDNPIYYLSTNIIPAHRFERIQQVGDNIKENKSPILIATQVVEAGVDLDFDMGFRDIGPIDSIIQVAGRINRNNNLKKKHSPLYIVDFNPKKTKRVYGLLSYLQSTKALRKQDVFKEEEYLELIEGYFNGISDKSSFKTAREFFRSMKKLHYSSDNKDTHPISSFRIIEESNFYATVFIENSEEAIEIQDKYLQKIKHEITKENFDRNWKLKFQQQIISVPQYLCDDLEPINKYEDNILVVAIQALKERYDLNTGFKRDYEETNSSFTF